MDTIEIVAYSFMAFSAIVTVGLVIFAIAKGLPLGDRVIIKN